MGTDTNFDSIFTNLDKYMEPLQQKKSLLQEYQSMSKALGIEDINEELIDAKRIIEGTEDDIRAEVTAAGGFATDSQVLAMANARNKSLIKNYNVLLESRDNAMQQLNTMMNLTIEDRRAAEAEFDRKIGFAFKVAEFQQRAQDNARSQLNSVVTNLGYGGLLAATNGNAYEQSLIEKTLGLGVGGLTKLAGYKKPLTEEEQLDLELTREQIKTEQAQRSKIYTDIKKTEMEMGEEKPLTQAQSTALGFGTRLLQSNDILKTLDKKFASEFQLGGEKVPTFLKSSDRQSYEQAQRNFVNAVLRRESGAAISPSEFENARKQYFAVLGDTESTVKQKQENRQLVIRNFLREGGQGDVDPTRLTVSPSGELIEITN